MPDRIDPDDPQSVAWLQLALSRLLPQPRPMMIGDLDYMTWKAIEIYQQIHGLEPTPVPASEQAVHRGPPVNGRPVRRAVPLRADQEAVLAPLLQHVRQQLKMRGLTVS